MTAIRLQPVFLLQALQVAFGAFLSYHVGGFTYDQTNFTLLLFDTTLSAISAFIFMTFTILESNEPLIEVFRPFIFAINCIRLVVFMETLGTYFQFTSLEEEIERRPTRMTLWLIIRGSQYMFTIYIFCIFFPIKLGNAYMHAMNGNIPPTSSIDKSGNLRAHRLGDLRMPKNFFIPNLPTVNVEHNIKWGPGDKIINSVYNYFKGTPQEEEYTESYHTCEEEKSDLFSFISSPKTILILFVCTLLIFAQIQNRITRSLLIVNIGIIMALKFSGHFSEFTSVDLLYLWGRIPPTEDLEMDEIQPQGFVLDIPMFSGVLITSLTALSGYNAKQSLVDGLIKATRVSDVQTSNITTLIMTISTRVHDFLLSISQDQAASYFDVSDQCGEDVKLFQTKVVSFCASFNTGEPDSMLYCMDVYKQLYDEGRLLAAKVSKHSFDLKIVNDCVTKLTSIYQKISDMKLSVSGERVETVCVCLRGQPGVMKGVLVKRLAKVVAMATLPIEWRPSYKQDSRPFSFNVPTDSFWDTYTNKAWVTFFDDIFQRRDAAADSDSDALKLKDMVNSAPFTLKMANVNQKNNTFFRSAFLFCTSNVYNYNLLASVADTGAITRRMHICVDVALNNKYLTKGVLDKDKLPNTFDSEGKNLPNDFWHLTVTETHGNVVSTPRAISMKELIKMIIKRYHSHKKNFLVNRKSEEELVNSLAKEMGFEWDQDIPVIGPQGGLSRSDISVMEPLMNKTKGDLLSWESTYWDLCNDLKRLDLYADGFLDAMKTFHEFNDDFLKKHLDDKRAFFSELNLHFDKCIKLQIHPLTNQPEWPIDFEKPKPGPIVILKSAWFAFKEWLSENLFLVLGAGILTGSALYYLSQFFDSVMNPSSESVDYKRMGSRKTPGKQIKLSLKANSLRKIEPQGGVMPNFDFSGLPKFKSSDFGQRNNQNDVLAKMFNKYFFIMYIVEHSDVDFEPIRYGHAINVMGQLFLIPFHFIFLMSNVMNKPDYMGATVILTTSSGNNRYSVAMEEFCSSFKTTSGAADKDVCLVKLPCAQKMSKGAISNFLTNSDVADLVRTTSFNADLIGSYQIPPNGISIRSHATRAAYNPGGITITSNWDTEKSAYELFDTMMYRTKTTQGDCGSMVVASDSNYENRFIAGIHSAGDGAYGYATTVTRESLQTLVDELFPEEIAFKDVEVPDYLEPKGIIEPQGGLIATYDLKPPYTVIDMSKSDIKKSKLFGKLPGYERPGTRPARLKSFMTEDGEIIDPLEMAFNKYGKTAPDICVHLVNEAIESYENLLNDHYETKPEFRRVMTLKEALHSFGSVNTINSSTSSGFPMSLACETDLKKEYYAAFNAGLEEETESAYQRIATLVESTLKLLRDGIRPFMAYKDCAKDEIRSVLKFLAYSTRLFAACPFILLLLFRMYFGNFISDFIAANLAVGSAVGINPYSSDWDAMARMLLKFSSSDDELSIGAGDQGEFDTRQWTIVHNGICDMINRFYPNASKEEIFIRTALFCEITNSNHIFRNAVYECYSGLPSGNPMTAIVNTIYNHIVFRICWAISGLCIKQFNACVVLMVLGDDNVFSVHKNHRHIFNEMTLVYLMEQIGMKYTTELKGTSEVPFRSIDKVEFLKRSFKKDMSLNRWVAPLRKEAIFEMLNWTKKGKEGDQITLDNMCFALREMSLHGKDIFEVWVKHFLNLKSTLFPFQKPHGDMPLNYENTYKEVLSLEYFF